MSRVRARKWCVPKWVYMKYREITGLTSAAVAKEALEEISNYTCENYTPDVVKIKSLAREALIKLRL